MKKTLCLIALISLLAACAPYQHHRCGGHDCGKHRGQGGYSQGYPVIFGNHDHDRNEGHRKQCHKKNQHNGGHHQGGDGKRGHHRD